MIKMAEENTNEKNIQEIKELLKTDKIILGTEETFKEMKKNNISAVYLSSNVPKDTQDSINHYSELCGAKVINLSVPNDELGVLCQKPFYVSVLGVRK